MNWCLINDKEQIVCLDEENVVCNMNWESDNYKNNATLIVNAPKLLKVCEILVESVYKCNAQDGDVVCSANVVEIMEEVINEIKENN